MKSLFQFAVAFMAMIVSIWVPLQSSMNRSPTPAFVVMLLLAGIGCLLGILRWPVRVLAVSWLCTLAMPIVMSIPGFRIDMFLVVTAIFAVATGVPWFAGIAVGRAIRS